jgi:hypothetical protein
MTRAFSECSNNSTPGPDQIPYDTWKQIQRINPNIILSLLSPLLPRGHHPSSHKAANRIVPAILGKKLYAEPASFRIIIRLENISKILERIVTFRLSDHPITSNFIHTNQGGSHPVMSTSDAVAILTPEIKLLQAAGLKV